MVNVFLFSFSFYIISLQAELFDKFLHGKTLEGCYSAVASVANGWLDLLDVCKISLLLTVAFDF